MHFVSEFLFLHLFHIFVVWFLIHVSVTTSGQSFHKLGKYVHNKYYLRGWEAAVLNPKFLHLYRLMRTWS